jgi:hypothetical protein
MFEAIKGISLDVLAAVVRRTMTISADGRDRTRRRRKRRY